MLMKLRVVGQKLAENLGQLGMGWSYDKTMELAKQWFRETHDLDIAVERMPYVENKIYEAEIQYEGKIVSISGEYESYEDALKTALYKACQMVI